MTTATVTRQHGVAAAAALLAFAVGLVAADPLTVRLALVATALVAALAVAGREPRVLLYGALVWLPLMGTARRVVSAGFTATTTDPLLLVAPAAVVLLVVVAAREGAFARRTRLATAVLALGALALVGAANPLQGGPAVGAAGLLFVLVPMLWFWVARALVDDRTFRTALAVAAVAGVAVALYGLSQTYNGFTGFDQRWIDAQGYTALLVEGTVRPFSTFSSASEYAIYLGIALVVWFAYGTTRRWGPLPLAAVALVGTALFLESSRGALAMGVAAVGVVAAAKRRVRIATASLAVAGALVALSAVASQFAGGTYTDERTGSLLRHQLEGLADPFHPTRSTLWIHLRLMGEGLSSVAEAPAGLGTGSVTIAGAKFGGSTAGTETDPSNAAVALGIPGLLAYLGVVVVGVPTVYRLARDRGDVLGYAALGILAVTGLQWLNGGSYATAVWPWLVLGWADRQTGA